MSNNLFPSFLDTSNSSNTSSLPRLAPSPMSQQQSPQQLQNNANGNASSGGINGGLPMIAGQQMDVNFLFQKVMELSDVLRENREKTQGIVAGAEELATRAAANGATPSLQEANAEVAGTLDLPYLLLVHRSTDVTANVIATRIADLERRLLASNTKLSILLSEQKENTVLIGEWEHEVGKLVEKVREHTFNNKAELYAQAQHYNKLLQEEKDEHLQARLEKDEWHKRFMRSVGMLREAYRLTCEEEETPVRVVSGLQNEVRALRSALGMEAERSEDEGGWEILKGTAVDT